MNRFNALILVLLIFLSSQTLVYAQVAPCNAVTTEVTQPSPQSGAHNYFGVKVTLDKTYDFNITVHGYIYDDGDEVVPNTDHPFTLVVDASNLTNETAITFYQTSPSVTNAIIEVNSITPIPCYSNPYNYVGQLHNDGLDSIYVNLSLPASSIDDIFDVIQSYFNSLGTATNDTMHIFLDSTSALIEEFQDTSDVCVVFTEKGYSGGFCTYFNDINTLLMDATSVDDFYFAMGSLEEEISNSALSSDEKQILLNTAAVTRYSAYYWNYSGRIAAWQDKYENQIARLKFTGHTNNYGEAGPCNPFGNDYNFRPYPWSWKDFASADLHGAVQGAIAGAVAALYTGGISIGAATVGWGAALSGDYALTQFINYCDRSVVCHLH